MKTPKNNTLALALAKLGYRYSNRPVVVKGK